MEHIPGPADAGQQAARLLTAARQLKETATLVGRLDVAAKADEAIALIAGAIDPVDRGERKPEPDGKGNTVVKILDGLGF